MAAPWRALQCWQMPEPLATTHHPERLVFGEFSLDLAAQQLSRGGQALHLPPRVFAVLVHLAGSAGRLVTKDQLLDAVWGHRAVSDSALKVAINALRTALGDDPKAPLHLETVARRGYRFLGVIQPVQPVTAQAKTNPDAALPPSPAQGAPAASAADEAVASRGNLPPPQPGLIGRDADLLRLAQALAVHRLVTLHGPGGVGKTRLALAAAGLSAPVDGVWLLRLDTLSNAAPLLDTVARTLGLGLAAQTSLQALARAMAGLRLRLVVDNAEHLLAAVAELVEALLAGAPGVQMLVTSQAPLQLDAELLMPVAPLALPAQADVHLGTSPAVQLLLQRARLHQPDLGFDASAAREAAAICRALEGLPLALELAAARVPLLGWAGVHRRLGERLSLLTRGPRGAPERHRTLRAALAWTHDLLTAPEQRLLQALSVFAGSFTVEDAVAVCSPGGPARAASGAPELDILDTLRERSLLVRGDDVLPRLRLYDSVRAFAAEGLLASGRQAEVVARLLERLTAVFTAADLRFGRTPQLVWLAELRPSLDNLRAALQDALAEPALLPAAGALFTASVQFRVRGGWAREALQDHNRLCAGGYAAATPPRQAAWDLAVALLAVMGQVLPPQQGLEAARRAAAYFEQAHDVYGHYLALNLQANALMRLQTPVAERCQVVARARAIEPAEWGTLQRRLGVWSEAMVLRDQGELETFEARCLAYMANGRALGDFNAAWVGAQGLAQAMVSQRRTEAAMQLLAPVVAEMRLFGVLRENAHVLAQWACLRVTLNAEPDAVQALKEAADLMQADGRLWWMADALAWLPAWQGRWADAARVQAWADELVRQRGDQRGLLFGALRQRLGQWLAEQPEAAHCQAVLATPPALDEAGVMAMVFDAPLQAGLLAAAADAAATEARRTPSA